MDKLKEIIDLLNLNKTKSIETIDSKTPIDSKLMQFYHHIRGGQFSTDQEAKDFLYPNAKSSNAYYKLKHTLRDRLYNTIFFIDVKKSKYSDIHNAYLNIQKIISLIRILLTKGLKKNAIYMAKKGLKVASFYQFTEEELTIARILRSNAAAMLGNEQQYLEYDLIVNNCLELFRSEIKVEGFFYNILTLYVNDKSTKPFVYNQTSKYLEELDAYTPKQPSANWIYHFAMINIFKYMSINDHEKSLEICEVALKEISQFDFKHTKSIVNISSQAISCCIHLKQYEKGEKNIKKGLEIMQPGIFNWFKYKELHLTLSLHTKRYSKAWNIFNEATSHNNFKTLQNNLKEVWRIYEAWLNFFIIAEKLVLENEQPSKKIRIAKFANNVPTFFKDKRGLNVPILILQIVLLLQQQKLDTVLDRVEAIAKYKDRYLDKTHNFRSNIFINMLLTIPKAHFRKEMVIKQSQKYRSQLDKVPLDIANQSADIEILPYEDVWEILLEQLK